MTERLKFVADCLTGLYGISELAEQYGISRKTGYKWARRFLDEGIEGLGERGPVAVHVANRTPSEIERLVVELRGEHVTWGPKKLLAVLERREPGRALPARSTVAEILKRNGLVNERRARRRREGHPGRPQGEAKEANAIWGADFKGQFLTRDGRYCYPFTVTDLYSRYVICCDGYLSTGEKGVKESLERAFREHGMPAAIRTDNGSPFASTGIGRLTRLAVWLVKLGIGRQLIQPGKPGQNGSHERMHRTLKKEATRPPQSNVRSQQKTFDAFVEEFNEKRPHEAIGMKTPAELYGPSERPFPERLGEPEYPGHFEVRRVSRNGGVRFRGEWLNVGHSLIEENVGLEAVGDGIWDVHFAKVRIGRFDERDLRLVGSLATHPRCGKRGNRPPGEGSPRESNPGDSLPSHSATDHS
jgi:transposase InsO family protein